MELLHSKNKTIRRFQILALCLAEPGRRSVEIAKRLKCSVATIKNEIKTLRGEGYDINVSENTRKGYILDPNSTQEVFRVFCKTHFSLDPPIEDRDGNRYNQDYSLGALIYVFQCIQNRFRLGITTQSDQEIWVNPINMLELQANNEGTTKLRLLCWYENELKQVFLDDIERYRTDERQFEIREVPQALIADSLLMAWYGTPGEKIKLQITEHFDKFPYFQKLFANNTSDAHNNALICTTTTSSLELTARWLLGQGGNVTPMEPQELKNKVHWYLNELKRTLPT